MKIIINPKYNKYTDFISNIPKIFEESGQVIYTGRNILKTIQIDNIKIVIKSFQRPNLINRIIYTFIRKSKAERSYLYSLKILSKGFITPDPIAFIETYDNNLISKSYYICINQEDRNTVRSLMGGEDTEDYYKKIEQFAKYSADLHSNGILHLDYSAGNILYKKDNNNYTFSLIDVNRLKFQIPNRKTTINNLNRISTTPQTLKPFSDYYCKYRGWDNDLKFSRHLEISSDLFHFNKALKHSFKDLITKRRETKTLFPISYFCLIKFIETYSPKLYNKRFNYYNEIKQKLYSNYLKKYDNRKIFSDKREYPLYEIAYLKKVKALLAIVLIIYILIYFV